jgi:hypothetical protein
MITKPSAVSEFVWYSPYHDQLFVNELTQCRHTKKCTWKNCPSYILDMDRSTFRTDISPDGKSGTCGPDKIFYEVIYYMGEL